MKLSRITSEFSYGDFIIHKFGLNDDGKPIHTKTEFRDWFYFKADQIGQLSRFDKIDIDIETVYKSLYGDDCYKIEYTSIREKNKIVKAFPEYVFESDVKPEFKHLMQRKNLEWADAKDRNIGCFDIETFSETDEFSGPDNPFAPITSIQLHASRQDQYYMFAWHPTETEHLMTPEIVTKGDVTYIFCRDEVDVILSFFEFVKDLRIDVLSGWFSKGFDLPYICSRCDRINIDYNQLSPIGRVSHYNKGYDWKTYIDGLDHIDMLEAVRDELNYNMPNNKLDTAMKVILDDEEFEKETEVTWRDWKDNFTGFMKYGLMDVKGLVMIDRALGIFDLFCTVQKITNITQLGDISFKSSVVDKFILSDCKDQYVFPTRRTGVKHQYKGAMVLDPKHGLHHDIGLVDYASLYPTCIMSFNLSPETFICSQTQVEELGMTVDDVIADLNKRGIKFIDTGYDEDLVGERYLFYSQESKLGFLPHILKKMYAERVAIKGRMKKLKYGSKKYNALDKHQYALKIILNSAYGAFGFNYFRLYKIEVADAITFFARKALQFLIDHLEVDGFRVIYGDTDSCFFSEKKSSLTRLRAKADDTPNYSSDQIDEIAKQDILDGVRFDNGWVEKFNDKLLPLVFIPTYNNGNAGKYSMMDLEWEKSFDRLYFGAKWIGTKRDGKVLTGTKKRYYGIEPDGKKYIKGLNIIRKDTPPFLKRRLSDIIELAVMEKLTIQDVLDLRNEVEKQPYETIGVTKSYGQPFKKFKNKANHVEGAKFANEILGTKITHKDKPFLFFITSRCEDDLKKKEQHSSICLLPDDLHFIDERTDLFEIDYTTYFKKQVMDQLKEFEYIESVATVLEEYKEVLKDA